MVMDDRMLIIRRNDFLAKLKPEDFEDMNIMHNFIVADKDAYIYNSPQSLNKLYFIKEGHIKLGYVDDDGNEMVKEILEQGDVFGQLTLAHTGMPGEFARAFKMETILCAFTIQDFERLLQKRPDMAVQFVKKIGQKSRKIEHRLVNLLQKDVRTRLLFFFWTLSQQYKVGGSNSVSLDNFLTHEDIARLTGTSRQTVTTLISRFTEEGLIEIDRRAITIHNIKLLQKEAKVG